MKSIVRISVRRERDYSRAIAPLAVLVSQQTHSNEIARFLTLIRNILFNNKKVMESQYFMGKWTVGRPINENICGCVLPVNIHFYTVKEK